jgi:phosphosulfolactate synthase
MRTAQSGTTQLNATQLYATQLESARSATSQFVACLGVRDIAPAIVPFDPGYDPVTLESHLAQSGHLMEMLKLSMACWLIANESATREKLRAAARFGVGVVTGGGPFEVAATLGRLDEYLDLCGELGITRIEAGEGFTTLAHTPDEIVGMARARGLDVQAELGDKHGGSFSDDVVSELVVRGCEWLDAGAVELVIEGRESADEIGIFRPGGALNEPLADRLADAFGLNRTVFEAPTKQSQFALLNHFGPSVHLGNVRLEEVLRVEIYRRGLHSDAFAQERLTPRPIQVA